MHVHINNLDSILSVVYMNAELYLYIVLSMISAASRCHESMGTDDFSLRYECIVL